MDDNFYFTSNGRSEIFAIPVDNSHYQKKFVEDFAYENATEFKHFFYNL
jgi:hypothetical protein